MIWNNIVVHYEKYHVHHVILFILLLVYSYIGALVFCALESNDEDIRIDAQIKEKLRNSVSAKKIIINNIHSLFSTNLSITAEVRLRTILDEYDTIMGLSPSHIHLKKWDLWGGLYYAGTIYTTIGYGDLAASTTLGRLFTMLYAIFGIPMVITILNDWGTIMFQAVDVMWKNNFRVGLKWIKHICMKTKRANGSEEEGLIPKKKSLDDDEPVPLLLVVIVLVFWISLCCIIFSILEGWTLFEAVYFFFISLTTIGLGDLTPSPRVAVANFLLILIGLSVVSLAINVVQQQLERIFVKIVKSIDSDFKKSLTSDERKASTATLLDVKQKKSDVDVADKFGQNMGASERILMKFMSSHQRKMLNDKAADREKMRNRYTQTSAYLKVASVQTTDRIDQIAIEEDHETSKSTNGLSNRKLYIYNTGE